MESIRDLLGGKGEWSARLADLKYTLYLLRRNPLVMVGSLLSIFFIILALTANLVVDPNLAGVLDYPRKYVWSIQAINWGLGTHTYAGPEFYILGTDGYGRDLLKMIILALPLDIANAFIIVLVAGAIGVTIGALAGYVGGVLDEAALRITDIFFAFPGLILALVFAALFGRTIDTLRLAILLVWWPTYVRLARGQILAEKEKAYVEALKALGGKRSEALSRVKLYSDATLHDLVRLGRYNRALVWWVGVVSRIFAGFIGGVAIATTHLRILFRHILPNSIYPVLIQATLDLGGVILTFSALMFLGFSPSPTLPELGNLAADGYQHIFEAPWLLIFPGLTILIIALAFNLVGDGLRDVLDPRLRR